LGKWLEAFGDVSRPRGFRRAIGGCMLVLERLSER